ncbi:MAG: NAD(P)-dependent oxidoreductase [Alphaproteobacteria bacterium]|nr:NAD(P)-dependent oxidoreductase [Alphaproteobacteria bacterium]
MASKPGGAAARLGWIGIGRMGYPMAARLAKAGAEMAVYNRTRAKAEPLREVGASVVDTPAELAGREIVFTMVSTSEDLLAVTLGKDGLLSRPGQVPKIVIDCSTVSEEASAKLRAAAAERGAMMLAAPVSGNAKVVKAGKLSLVVSGPRPAYDRALPWLEKLGTGVAYVGEGELARIVKICHNVFLGVVIQSLVEITVLAEKAGVPRHAFLEFMNQSVMGSVFTRYKTPALVKLDFTTTFTPPLLRKDMDLGLAAAKGLNVPMPVAAAAREMVQALIGNGHLDDDFATLLLLQARNSGLILKPEAVAVADGLT